MADDDDIPSVEEFELLHEIDAFNAKIKQAVTALKKRYPDRLVQYLLDAHAHGLMPELPLVNQVALDADRKTGGRRRREIAERLVAAGALSDAGLERLRKRLSEARRDRGDLIDVDELEHYVPLPDDDIEAMMDEAVARHAEDEAEASVALAALYRLGVFSWLALRMLVASDGCCHGITDDEIASVLTADASAVKTDG